MVQITITATMNVVVQDPMPAEGAMSITVANGTSESRTITGGQFSRIATQLVALETLGALTYVVTAIPDTDTRAQDADLFGLPTIGRIDADTITAAGDVAREMQGMNLVAYQGIAQYLFADSADPLDVNKQILIAAAQAGLAGNLIDIIIEDSGGGVLTIAVVPVVLTGRTEITIDVGGAASTYAQINTAINGNAATCLGIISSTLPGTGATAATINAKTPLAGGSGTGMTLTICDELCTIRNVDLGAVPGTSPQVMIFDVPSLAGIAIAGEMVNFVLRSGAKIATMSVPLV